MRARVGSGLDDKPRARAALAWRALPGAPGLEERAPRWAKCIVALAMGLLALVAAPRRAAAQTTSTQNSLTTLSSPNRAISMNPNAGGVDRVREYYTPTRPWWINYNDCYEDNGDEFIFTLTSNTSGDQLEIWAGSENCAANRSDQDHGQCWIVASQALQDDTVEIRVPVRNIIARRVGVDVPPVGLTRDVCDDNNDPSGEALTLYFMVVESGQGDEYFAWDGGTGGFGFDVVGPSPPGRISVGVGESQLAIDLDDIPTDTQRERYEAFCVPEGTTLESLGLDAGAGSVPPGADTSTSADAGDAGLDAGSSGSDAGTDPDSAPTECYTDVLRVGGRPPPEFSCGESSRTSTTLRTDRLANNINYAVAVAGQDDLGNAGVISQIQCGRPIPLADFYEEYSRAGGFGGGGFCNLSPGQQSAAGALGLATLGLALAGLGWRRKKGRA